MSGNPKDDEHESQIDSAWRHQFDEEPSAPLDASIRAAARREAMTARGQRSPRRWQAQWTSLAAAAGVGVLAFGLLRWLPVDNGSTVEVQSPVIEPADTASPRQSAETLGGAAAPESGAGGTYEPPSSPEADANVSERPAAAPPAVERRERMTGPFAAEPSMQDRAEDAPVRSKGPATPPSVLAPAPSTEAVQESVPSRSAPQSNAAEVSVTGASAKPARSDDEIESTQARLRRIVDLHAAGRLDEAAELLRELRAIEPRADEQLPAELRPWAATVLPHDGRP